MTYRMWIRRFVLGSAFSVAAWAALVAQDAVKPASDLTPNDVEQAIQAITRVGPQASGSVEARQACERLQNEGPDLLPRLLVAMDTPNIVAANWYRCVFERIVERELAKPNPALPREFFEQFVREANHGGRARRLAFHLLQRLDPEIPQRLMPAWLDDREFRSDAVEFALRAGDQAKKAGQLEAARHQFRLAFDHARRRDQVLAAMQRLATVGEHVDAVTHLGFVTRWWLLGPFPAPGTTGFGLAFGPEQSVDLDREVENGEGRTLQWKLYETPDPLGEVNLIQAIGPERECLGYAYAELESPREQQVQLRGSADDNLTVWLNGGKVLAREQWLNGTRFDRFIVPVTLRAGTNRVLVKICQGPHHVNPDVPNNWSFQLRFCDETGGAVDLKNRLPSARPGKEE